MLISEIDFLRVFLRRLLQTLAKQENKLFLSQFLVSEKTYG
jgi:hypothetical protein